MHQLFSLQNRNWMVMNRAEDRACSLLRHKRELSTHSLKLLLHAATSQEGASVSNHSIPFYGLLSNVAPKRLLYADKVADSEA